MTDIIDRAAALEEALRGDAIEAQARRAGLNGKTVEDSARNCRICDQTIPQARREAYQGVQTCVGCQADLETAIAGGVGK